MIMPKQPVRRPVSISVAFSQFQAAINQHNSEIEKKMREARATTNLSRAVSRAYIISIDEVELINGI